MNTSLVKDKSYSFALNIIKLSQCLHRQHEFVISRQLMKSGTSIGANIEEALAGQSRADFVAKMSIASKEARETNYWLRLIRDGGLLVTKDIDQAVSESSELIKMLTAIVKTTQKNQENAGFRSATKNSKLKTQN